MVALQSAPSDPVDVPRHEWRPDHVRVRNRRARRPRPRRARPGSDRAGSTWHIAAVGSEGEGPLCSARGCHAPATWAIVWNNPKIHTADREKVWAACDQHKQSLTDYLTVRSFLTRVEPWKRPS